LKDSTDIAADFLKIVQIYEDCKSQLTQGLIHLDRNYSAETGIALGRHLDETFYFTVLAPSRSVLSPIPSYENALIKYNTTRRGSLPSGYPYTTYQRDSVYVGELDEGNRREGYGKCTYYNGDCYEGYWSNDRTHGQGLYVWKDGGRYEGDFVEGKMQGKGRRTFASGAVYQGNFEAGRKHGLGSMRFKNGDSYEGEWNYDEMTGSGEYTWHTGDRFVGKFHRDKREGMGVLFILATGEELSGEWGMGR
jgi:hypothetical protein